MHALLKSKEEPAGLSLSAAFDRPGRHIWDALHHTHRLLLSSDFCVV